MSLLPRYYLSSVVALEERDRRDHAKHRCFGTGFLVGFDSGDKDSEGKKLYKIFLVTNRHCFEDGDLVILRFNIKQGKTQRYELSLKDQSGSPTWIAHPNPRVDVAAVRVPVPLLEQDNIDFHFISEDNMAFLPDMAGLGIAPGDHVFVLGFPMGLAGDDRNYVVVRGGTVARLDSEIVSSRQEFLIDATIFPGNSGGPVVIEPTRESLTGQKPITRAYVIGLVRRYLLYKDRAISAQTGEVRVVFTENSGLAGVVPMDLVKETVSVLLKVVQPGTAQGSGVSGKDSGIPAHVGREVS